MRIFSWPVREKNRLLLDQANGLLTTRSIVSWRIADNAILLNKRFGTLLTLRPSQHSLARNLVINPEFSRGRWKMARNGTRGRRLDLRRKNSRTSKVFRKSYVRSSIASPSKGSLGDIEGWSRYPSSILIRGNWKKLNPDLIHKEDLV